MISIKSNSEIERMKKSGKIVARVLEALEKAIVPGISTLELDRIAEDIILSSNAYPSFKGYEGPSGAGGFPASICASINNEVVHGIPGLRKLKNGDIISIDVGAFLDGFHGDAARTYPVGDIDSEALRLIDVTRQSFFEAIKMAVKGNRIYEISMAIQNYVESNGFSVVREYVGHGIGREMHEAPQIPNYVARERGPRLASGMALAIEPMVNQKNYEVRILENRWTVVTADGGLSAHYENTLVVTDGEPCITTV